jgi:CheY-like chemotaxis protein
MDGREVAKRLRADLIDPPQLIAITGYGQPGDRDMSLDAGFFAHLTKPVDIERLTSALEQIYAKKR